MQVRKCFTIYLTEIYRKGSLVTFLAEMKKIKIKWIDFYASMVNHQFLY